MLSEISAQDTSLLLATVILGEAVFGIDTTRIQEVVVPGHITAVHRAPAYVAGIRNLRGQIVTVIDLRTCLGLGQVVMGPETRLLIVQWHNEPVGLLVDGVVDSLSLPADALSPVPSSFQSSALHAVTGVYQDIGTLVSVLDLDRVLPPGEQTGSVRSMEGRS
jgi:purine-binding chemotaxis protein CheW